MSWFRPRLCLVCPIGRESEFGFVDDVQAQHVDQRPDLCLDECEGEAGAAPWCTPPRRGAYATRPPPPLSPAVAVPKTEPCESSHAPNDFRRGRPHAGAPH